MAIRWGICSAGMISHDFLVALTTLPPEDHQAVAIASQDRARSQAYAKKHGIPRAYGSYEELAQDPDVDIVSVGTINTEHHRLTILFLRAQKNVLCEKPFAMNAAEVQDMIQDMSCPGAECLPHRGVGETASIILNYSGNRQAVLNITMVIKLPGGAVIGGSKGVIQIPSLMNCPTAMLVNGNCWEWPLPRSPEPLFFDDTIGLRYEAEHVRQCLLKGLKESPIMPLGESEIIATILDEARKQVGVFYEDDETTEGQSETTK